METAYYLEWFSKTGAELLVDEEELPVDLPFLRDVFGLDPCQPLDGGYPVEPRHLGALQPISKHAIDLKRYAYFVACTQRHDTGSTVEPGAFGVVFLEPDEILGPTERYGRIFLPDLSERFQACIGEWQPEDYERMCAIGVERALGGQPGALINSYAGPHTCLFLSWWPLYRRGEEIHMQQHVIFERPEQWSWSRPWERLPPYREQSEDGDRISTWTFPLRVVQAWLERCKQQTLAPRTAVDPGSLSTRDAAAFTAAATHLNALTEDWERKRFDGFVAVDLESRDPGWLITFQARRGVENGRVEDLRACARLLYVEADDLRVHALTDAEFRNGVQRLEAEIALGRDLLDRDATAPDLSKSLQTKLTKAFPASDASTPDEAATRSPNAELATRLLRGFTPAFTERHGRAPWPRLTLTILSKSAGDLPRLRANLAAALEDWRTFVGNMPEE